MRITALLIALLPLAAQAGGTLLIQPQPDNSIRVLAQGATGSSGREVLGLPQPASSSMAVTVSPSGMSQCEGGDIVLNNLRISFINLRDNSKVLCGTTATFDAQGRARDLPLRVAVSQLSRPVASMTGRQRQAMLPAGYVSTVSENGQNQQVQLYLDLSAVQQPEAVLTASFSRPFLSLGGVGELNDAAADVQLQVGKTDQAGNEAIGYTLSFESVGQLSNQYRLQAPGIERRIPYQILVGGHEVLPEGGWRGTVPAGVGAQSVVDIRFKLVGKQTRGMMPGVRLQDTVTAVITPDS